MQTPENFRSESEAPKLIYKEGRAQEPDTFSPKIGDRMRFDDGVRSTEADHSFYEVTQVNDDNDGFGSLTAHLVKKNGELGKRYLNWYYGVNYSQSVRRIQLRRGTK